MLLQGSLIPTASSASRIAVSGWILRSLALVLLFLPLAKGAELAAGYRAFPLALPASGHPGFTSLSPTETGVDFTNTLSEAHAAENQIRLNGSGVALGDADGDGWCDVFAAALERHLALYRNLGGWHFTNVSAAAGLDQPGRFSTGATFADVDGDGDLDLLVNGIGLGTRLFLNDGQGHFTEALDSGLDHQHGATTATLADIDGDGLLDLYVANYRTNTVRTTGFALLNVGGRRMIAPEDRGHLELLPTGRVLEHGEPHFLYRNDGHGHFQPLSWTDGTFLDEDGRPLAQPPSDWGLTAAFRDLNGDGFPDLYVCNDFQSPDRIWLNDGHGKFRAIPRLAVRHSATFSMSIDFADVDRDGRDDFLVSDMLSRNHARRLMQMAGMDPYDITVGVFDDRPQLDRTVLQWNRGDGTYADIAHYAGLEASEWNWSVVFLDVDLDGFEDLLASTGHMFDTQDLDAQARIQARGPYPREQIPNKLLMLPPLPQAKLAFRNRGHLTFEECGAKWGFNQVGVSQGMALGDLDNDGDLDVVVNNLNAALGLYRNDAAAARVAVRLRGTGGNTRGIGARITVHGGPVVQSQEMMCGGRYLSGDDAMRVFAAGNATNRLRIQVHWRSGRDSVVTNALANQLYVIDETAASASLNSGSQGQAALVAKPAATPVAGPIFQDVSERLGHVHLENAFADFERQPLLPRRLSQLGPGVAWWDVDGDGWEDLVIGSGQGGELAWYRNDGRGGFERRRERPWNVPLGRDTAGIAAWQARSLLVAYANYEDGQTNGWAVGSYRTGIADVEGLAGAWASSVGPLAVADYDGDGQLDLFAGGRVVAGRYPEAAPSRLYHGKEVKLDLDADNTARLKAAGLVSGAVWSDLDGDGWPDLVLACEWGPVRVFHNRRGVLEEVTTAVGLGDYTGWWNGVTTGDLDEDGRMDIVASNWGENTKYRASKQSPQQLYYGDFLKSGSINLLEAYRDPGTGRSLPERGLDAVATELPSVRERFPTYAAYGEATIEAILGDAAREARALEVTTLASTVFFNRTNRFVAALLPPEAQFAPAFAVCVGDFDGDGHEDVFLSQNFFATEPRTPRADAGRGLWLRGDGKGGLTPVPGQESGVTVYGEQRGATLGDYDHDGRVDLVVSQNGGQTRLFHNIGARPGLRVRLAGSPGNPQGVGSVVRLERAGWMGPPREVHAGDGYWSQAGVVQVLANLAGATHVWVRWPGGRITRTPIPAGATEVVPECPALTP